MLSSSSLLLVLLHQPTMSLAATAAATVSSYFSTSMHTSGSQICPNNYLLIKISCPRTLHTALVSHSLGIQLNPTSVGVSRKWRAVRIAAAVAQEKAALTEGEASDGVAAAENSRANTKLYIGNLPYHCDSAQLAGIIQEYAMPEVVEVKYDWNTGKSRGFAIVTMSSVEECNTIIRNLHRSEYGGRTLIVHISDPKPKVTEHKLFVGNLSWSVTSESLRKTFQPYGEVIRARVPWADDIGMSRGYGFVSYATRDEQEAALAALDGVELEGRDMWVSLAQGKDQ